MARAFAIFTCLLVALVTHTRAFMIAPAGSVGGATSFSSSAFTGLDVGHREYNSGHGTLEMMRHRKGFKKLNLPADQRKALLRGLTTQLIRHGRITTTWARAKELRKPVEHMITLSKKGTLHHRRQAMAYIYDKQLVHALFELGPERYGDRNGGYTRILKTDPRKGDNAKMAIIELV